MAKELSCGGLRGWQRPPNQVQVGPPNAYQWCHLDCAYVRQPGASLVRLHLDALQKIPKSNRGPSIWVGKNDIVGERGLLKTAFPTCSQKIQSPFVFKCVPKSKIFFFESCHSNCDHSQRVYFPPNRRRSIVFRVVFQPTNKKHIRVLFQPTNKQTNKQTKTDFMKAAGLSWDSIFRKLWMETQKNPDSASINPFNEFELHDWP